MLFKAYSSLFVSQVEFLNRVQSVPRFFGLTKIKIIIDPIFLLAKKDHFTLKSIALVGKNGLE